MNYWRKTMALDGIVLASIITELTDTLLEGRIDKIYQPMKDEIMLQIRSQNKNYQLLLSSNPSMPRIYMTEHKRENPQIAPNFCMLLRKHLQNGRIVGFHQPNFERIAEIHVQNKNELGDWVIKKLIIEIMGKHSNIILIEDGVILDSIRHISDALSSVREVMPGGIYAYPPQQGKINPLTISDRESFRQHLQNRNMPIYKGIYQAYTGISPLIAEEICYRAEINANIPIPDIKQKQWESLFSAFMYVMHQVRNHDYQPNIIFNETNAYFQFSAIPLLQYTGFSVRNMESISSLLDEYFYKKLEKNILTQRQKDLVKLVNKYLHRAYKKKKIQIDNLKETKKMDRYKLYGELLTANIYAVKKGMDHFKTTNYYSENQEEITIPLLTHLTPAENAQKFFKKYNKLKRTFSAATEQLQSINEEVEYLESIISFIQNSDNVQDLTIIRDELVEEGYSKKRSQKKKQKAGKPELFLIEVNETTKIYVGKNNIQNDYITFKKASNEDYWFHTQKIPGSHVILKTQGEPKDEEILLAAQIAAYHSKAKFSSQVPVDYTLQKYVNKPKGAKPGFVIYTHQNTVYVTPKKEVIEKYM